jgi:hypothetical protein
MIIWLPFACTVGQMARHPPVQVCLAAESPTSSYTVCPDVSTSTLPIDVDTLFRALADPLEAGLPCGVLDAPPDCFPEDELLLHPATRPTRAATPRALRPNLPIPKADICYLTSDRTHPNGCL